MGHDRLCLTISRRVRTALSGSLGRRPHPTAPGAKASLWSFRSIQVRLIKIGAKVISHARMTIFQMAEVAVPGELFDDLLGRIRYLATVPT
ncbi:MAG: transposase [Actinobacteria bacterium]|nr:transposase [Actinomycetota bacterium]